ncbi:MAG TPA: hypothetical protein VHC20_06440 [Candidatus Paceibacterota bacterium]|nr:hypothetical protein [Candidatus Paceibacterota bacterium]
MSYLLGYDAALDQSVLKGFAMWLICRADGFNNSQWSMIVLRIALPEKQGLKPGTPLNAKEARCAVDTLFDLLEEFFAYRESKGLRVVYLDYERWLRKQDWYDEDWPGWYSLDE